MPTALRGTILLTAVAAAFTTSNLPADDAKSAPATQKAQASDKEIIAAVGNRTARLYPKFGYPKDVFVADVGTDDPNPFLDYDGFGFKVKDKIVVGCIFFSDWKGTVLGAKMGDSPEEVEKKLGKPKKTAKAPNGADAMIWSFKDWDGTLQINFDKDKKTMFWASVRP